MLKSHFDHFGWPLAVRPFKKRKLRNVICMGPFAIDMLRWAERLRF